jgi:flagellar biosynthesis protein FlhF
MNMLSFLGETPTIALHNAQKECGEDAIVISTKKISSAKNGGVDMYEILVALEDEDTKLATKSKKFEKKHIAPQSPTTPYFEFKNEIEKMQYALEQVQKSIWSPKSQLYDLVIPPEFIDIYLLFEQNEFDQEMTYTILKKTIKQLPVALKENQKKVNDFFRLVLRRIIPVKQEIPLRKNQRKIMMMVGPTGVGKTTTIAKLAARCAYKLSSNYKVGIITLDSFRVGAIEQLKSYTQIMRLPLEVVKRPEEMSDAILRLKDCNYIFIDTAGSSQYDFDKIELINQYSSKIDDLEIEKILVMPANVKFSDLQEIYQSYARLGIEYLIFTKLDETRSFGNLISFAHKSKKSICYLSIGQNVPDDLIAADQNFLIECFMNRKCAEVQSNA